MKVLITGASGFLGKACVKSFANFGYKIISTDKYGDVNIVGDLIDEEFVSLLPDVDIVVNCAAVQYVNTDLPLFFRGKYFHKNNVITANNLFNRYKDAQLHFIHVGTSMMYSQTGQLIYRVNDLMKGRGVYSESKLKAQKILDNLDMVATVIPCIIGGIGREGLFRSFVSMIKKYGVVFFPGKGKHQINMVHVDDVADLIIQIAKTGSTGYFNAAAPMPLSINEWIDEIRSELVVERVKIIHLPLTPIKILSELFAYRILAREQLLMLKFPHVLDINESIAIGWKPKMNNAMIVRDIARYINESIT